MVAIFEEGMYFSYSYDLTEPLHFTSERKISQSCFNWAEKFQRELKGFDKMWSLPIIQGFVGKMEMYVNAKKIIITLISRRSRQRGGTQYYSTGLDKNGHTSNFVETEQILSIKNYLFSYLQVRGSVPLFWRQ